MLPRQSPYPHTERPTKYLIIDIREHVSMPFFTGWSQSRREHRTVWSQGHHVMYFDDQRQAIDEIKLIAELSDRDATRCLRVQPCKESA